MLENMLKDIGLSDKEIAVYLCVLQYQRILPSRVSSLTSINRPTIYSVAKELTKLGLIAEDVSGSSRYLISTGETSINNVAKKYERKAYDIKQKTPAIVDELRQLPKLGNYSIPRIRLIDEFGLRNFLIERSPVWAQSGITKDNTWWGFQDHTLLENYEDWADYFWKKFPNGIKLNLFTNKKEVETKKMARKAYSSQRNIKYLEKNSEFTATHVVIGDYILMIMTRERPHYLIEIRDKVMAENIRVLFKRMWGLEK